MERQGIQRQKTSTAKKDDVLSSLQENEKSILLLLSREIGSCRTYEDIQGIVLNRLHAYFNFNELMICLNSDDNLTHHCNIYAVSPETMAHPHFKQVTTIKYFINDGIFNVIEDSLEPVVFEMDELIARESRPFYVDFWHGVHAKELIVFPIRVHNECIGTAMLYTRKTGAFTKKELQLAQAICSYVGIALSNLRSHEKILTQQEEISFYKRSLEEQNYQLQEQVNTTYSNGDIIGSENGLQNVFKMISSVASSTSTVLIYGETGTGKELIARAIHHASPIKDNTMVKVNCAALPSNLIESELFGHERGSFTGAIERRIGKFELANNGTLFLDEIGEMNLELQAKLLRAIQEKEIERIGGKSVIKVNVRLIAASNRNLEKEVKAGRFRSDLFYRLNVFPIILPPLRERIEDVPMLVSHFIKKFSLKSGKNIKSVSPKVVREMMLYDWPGNVRELEHIIERTVLKTGSDTISEINLLKEVKNIPRLSEKVQFKSLEENEREYILSVLKKTNGKVSGAGGAAEILKIPATTLHSRIKKLGIRKKLH